MKNRLKFARHDMWPIDIVLLLVFDLYFKSRARSPVFLYLDSITSVCTLQWSFVFLSFSSSFVQSLLDMEYEFGMLVNSTF